MGMAGRSDWAGGLAELGLLALRRCEAGFCGFAWFAAISIQARILLKPSTALHRKNYRSCGRDGGESVYHCVARSARIVVLLCCSVPAGAEPYVERSGAFVPGPGFQSTARSGHDVAVCAMISDPPNPAIAALRAAPGFAMVAGAAIHDSSKTVQYQARWTREPTDPRVIVPTAAAIEASTAP
jgi:hypothetical protein